MKRLTFALLLLGTVLTLPVRPAAQSKGEVALRAAMETETVKGDLKGAIEQYRKIAQGGDRAVAAMALVRMAECYQKLGDAQAKKIFEQVVSQYGDQKEAVTLARAALGSAPSRASGGSGTLTARLVWKGSVIDASSSMTPDGRWLAMRDPSSGDIAIRDMSTGQIKRLMTKAGSWELPEFGSFPVLSPDSRQVAYEWHSGTEPATFQVRVMANEVGARPRTLISSPEYRGPLPAAWSTDGKSILTLVWKPDNSGQLVWVSAADGGVKVLKSLPWQFSNNDGAGTSVYFRPSLSPDGRFIAYAAFDRPGFSESSISVITADGSSEAVVVNTGGSNESPIWTPDGQHVLFTSNRSGTYGLWSIAVKDGKPAGVPTRVKSDIGRSPAVGFTRSGSYYYLNYGEAEARTFVADIDPATASIRGSAAPLETSFSNPAMAWSPDGRSIAFAKPNGLVVRSLETGESRAMLKSMSLGGSTMWLRDNKTLLQAVRHTQNRVYFGRVDVTTGEFREVLATGGTSGSLESALSPDEKTVYTNAGTGTGNGSPGIMAFDVATGAKRQVFAADADGLVPGLALSPDGRTLAFKVYHPGRRHEKHLCLIGVDGSGFREIYTDTEPGDGTLRPQLAWTRDGRSILFTRATGDGWQLMRIPRDGGTPEFTGLAGTGYNTNIDLNADGSRIAFNDVVSGANAELWVLDNLMSALQAGR